MKRLFLAALPLVCLTDTVAAQGDNPSREDVDALVEPYVGKDAPGIAVLVMRNGEILHMKGYGQADTEADVPVDADTVFDLASLSKQMTDMALMLLIDKGLVKEDVLLKDVLPAFKSQNTGERDLTIGDLVHHVSGLPDYASAGFDYKPESTNDEVIAWLVEQPLVRPPGTEFEYSNSGYVVLANVIAALDGKDSLADVLRGRIWGPLGMGSTNLITPAEGVDPAKVTKGYSGTNGDFKESMVPSALEGDGEVLTTISDLALYQAALDRNTLLDPDAIKRLCTTGTMDDGSPLKQKDGSGYGFGWNIVTDNGQDYCWHNGSWFGTSTV